MSQERNCTRFCEQCGDCLDCYAEDFCIIAKCFHYEMLSDDFDLQFGTNMFVSQEVKEKFGLLKEETMKFQKIQIKFYTSGGKVLDRKTEISFNGKPVLAKAWVDDLFRPEKLTLEFHQYHFFLSDKRIDVEGKLCIVIPPLNTEGAELTWFPHGFEFYYAKEWLPVKTFDLFMDVPKCRLVATIGRNFIELSTEDLSDASNAL